MSKPSSAKVYGKPRKSKWNHGVIGKSSAPLVCKSCNQKRNRFLRETLICALCAMKLLKKKVGSK